MTGNPQWEVTIVNKRSTPDLEARVKAAMGALAERSAALRHYNDQLLSIEDLKALPRPDDVVDGLLPAAGYSVVYGAPGVGKTLLCLALSECVRHGEPWLGHKTKAGPVLFIEGEDVGDFAPRLEAFEQFHEFTNTGSSYPTYYLPVTLDLTQPAEVARVIRTGESIRAKNGGLAMVVVDPLMEQMVGDENTEGMELVSRGLRVLADELSCCVLAGHHTNAAETRERGSAKLKARAAAMLRMEGIEGERVGLVAEKQRSGPKMAVEMGMVPSGPSVCLTSVWAGSGLVYGQRRAEGRERGKRAERQARQAVQSEFDDVFGQSVIREALADGVELNQTELLAACRGGGVGTEALKATLSGMVTEGEVGIRKKGRAILYRLKGSIVRT